VRATAILLIPAVPGLVDYFYKVPPKSSGKRRATLHLVVNLAAVLLFAISWGLRGGVCAQPMSGVGRRQRAKPNSTAASVTAQAASAQYIRR
jgi:hypothetical protein